MKKVCRGSIAAFTALVALQACGGGESSPDAGSPTSVQVGVFTLKLKAGGAGLDVIGPDGSPLLEGLGAGTVVKGDPPLVGFAAANVEIGYEMMFGAFKPADKVKTVWKSFRTVTLAREGGGATASILDASGALMAGLHFTSDRPGHLKAEIEKGAGSAGRFSWGWGCAAGEHFMGFGAQTWDVDHRGYTVPIWVQEQGIGKIETDSYDGADWMMVGRRHSSYLPFPQFLSSRGYMMTAQSGLRPVFAMCSEADSAARVEVSIPASIHVFYGPSPREAISLATAEFGRPRMPPRFAFAPWLDAIYGSENVRRVAKKLRDSGIPTSAIWTEDWRGAKWVGNAYKLEEGWDLDRTLYPDFELLAADLHATGYKFLLYFNTFVYQDVKAWEETAPGGLLIKNADGSPYVFSGVKFTPCSLIDLSNPGGRAWALGKLKTAISQGADGWMGDFAEWMPSDAVTYGGSGLDQHHLHPVQWQEVQREAFDTQTDGVDRLFFARSGGFGTASLADVVWAGDQRTDFQVDDGLPTIIPIAIGLGLAGISTYGHDIAGYQSVSNPPSTKELFFRWTELGAWSPVMRTHHGYEAKLNWNWERDQETTDHFRRYAKLHMALAPYFEGLARVASDTGMPIWRSAALEFPADNTAWTLKDQIMAGEFVMVAPVQVEGAVSRSVYLPDGLWYPWEGAGRPVQGGAVYEVSAPVAEIPAFARAGAVIPMYPPSVMTLANESKDVPGPGSVGDDRVVRIFLGGNGSFAEAGGLTYSLDIREAVVMQGRPQYQWTGKALAACKSEYDVNCVYVSVEGADVVKVVGNGGLDVMFDGVIAQTLNAEGGAGIRTLSVEVRY
ncbi:MAG: TIM-barrel domain-containing protein [Myxococcota bacterium]|jgi:alpha-glucosidase